MSLSAQRFVELTVTPGPTDGRQKTFLTLFLLIIYCTFPFTLLIPFGLWDQAH